MGFGIPENEKKLSMTGNIKFHDGRSAGLSAMERVTLATCRKYQLSLGRLQGLFRRLTHDPYIFREYVDIIQDQSNKGIIDVVPAQESGKVVASSNRVRYVPHHAVVRQDKTMTKVRIVYDASAKSGNCQSLNKCLLKGSKFNQLIFDIILV